MKSKLTFTSLRPNVFRFVVCLSLINLFGSLACTRRTTGPSNQEVKIGLSQEFETLNPLLMSMLTTTYLSGLVLRPLVVMNENGEWIPVLAKAIPRLGQGAEIITEGGIKKTRVLWEIKDNAAWSDGAPVTCEDFALSRTIALNPLISILEKSAHSDIERMEIDKQNPKKCFFVYKTLKWNFHQIGTFFPVPKHLEDSVYQQHKDQKDGYEKNTHYVKTPHLAGLYNGPYTVKELKLGSHLILEPNPHFYGAKPKIQRLIIKIVPSANGMEAQLRSGQIDMIASLGFSFDEALAFDKKVKKENWPFTVHFKPSQTYEHIDVNLEHPILKDVRVRKALMHAMNRVDLTTALFDGHQVPAAHFLASMDPWFTTDPQWATDYPYSKEKAAKLLDEAGWKLGANGIRQKNGEPLLITINSTAENKMRELVEQYLKDQWRQVGIDLEIKNMPARVFFSESIRKGQYPGLAMYALVSSSENIPLATLHSRSIPSEQNGWSGQNSFHWHNDKVDKAIDQMRTEIDATKRLDLIRTIIKEYTSELPALPLFYRSDVAVTPKTMTGYHLTGHQFVETYHAENWNIEAPEKN